MKYHDRPEVSRSDVDLIDESINTFLNKKNRKTTPAMELGTAYHTYILEPFEFNWNYEIWKKQNKSTTEGKKSWKECEERAINKIILDSENYEKFQQMESNLQKSKYYSYFIDGEIEIEKELLFGWEINDRIVECRAKPDLINHTHKVIIDLKTIASIGRGDYNKAIKAAKYEYCTQPPFYTKAVEANYGGDYRFIFAFCETSQPYDCYFIEAENFDSGLEIIENSLTKYINYLDNPNIYTGRGDVLHKV